MRAALVKPQAAIAQCNLILLSETACCVASERGCRLQRMIRRVKIDEIARPRVHPAEVAQ